MPLAKKERPGESRKTRGVEIEKRLASYGLAPGPRRLSDKKDDAEERPVRRLRAALIDLGPVFSAFGLYLSSRVDLLPANACLELAAIPDQSTPLTAGAALEVAARELECELGDVFLRFARRPYCATLRFQTHRARLSDGREALVRIVHPDFETRLHDDLPLLPALRGALGLIGLSGLQIEVAFAGFRRAVTPQAPLLHQAESLEALGAEAREFPLLKAPRVFHRLCTPRLLVIERLPGDNLQASISSAGPSRREAAMNDLAGRLCLAWLRQALLGDLFPVEPYPSNIVILPNQQISFIGGEFAKLTEETKARMLDYLTAASTQNPVKACSCLLAEMRAGKRAISEEELQLRFRQIVPFRDGGWGGNGPADSLAESLFVQWRFAGEGGWQAGAHLTDFFRGLFVTAAVARKLCPTGDPLLEGIENIRFHSALQPLRELFSAEEISGKLDQYAAMMLEAPRRLDEMLTLAVEGQALIKLHMAEVSARRRRKVFLARMVVAALALIGVWLLLFISRMR